MEKQLHASGQNNLGRQKTNFECILVFEIQQIVWLEIVINYLFSSSSPEICIITKNSTEIYMLHTLLGHIILKYDSKYRYVH